MIKGIRNDRYIKTIFLIFIIKTAEIGFKNNLKITFIVVIVVNTVVIFSQL